MRGWNQPRHRPQVETITPIARDTVIDHMVDGVMVVSSQNRVIDLNSAAARILGLRATDAIGRSLARVLADHPKLVTHYYDDQDLPVEITAGEGETERHYDVLFSRIDQQRDQAVGRLIVFRDVTARVREKTLLRLTEAEARRRLLGQYQQAQQELVELRRAEETLRKRNAGLESRVDERTTDLIRINSELAREIEERIQAEVELRRRNRELLSLQSAMAATVSSLDLPFVLETVTWEMVNLLGVDDCIISEWDAQADTLSVIAEYNSANEMRGNAGGSSYHLADFPLKKRALMERCAQQISVSQADGDSGEFTHMKEANVKTLLILPMVFQSRVVGLVELRNGWAERTLTDRDISLAQFLANQAAVAMENARLYAETQRRLREQTALREAGAAILSALDPKTVLSRIAEQTAQAIDATSAYICDYDSESKQATVLADYIGPEAGPQERTSDMDATYFDHGLDFILVMRAGQHDTADADDPDLAESDRAHMLQYGAKSILYIPLLIRDQLIGFVELWESRRQRQFTSDEINLCQGIAQQAAIALENAQLYERAQQEIAERIRAEEQILASLSEKEVLLQEIHHRVKNNLQVVSSLLSLQSNYVENEAALDMFEESQNRILSMALIHEKLYRSQDLARVDLAEYIQTLAGDLVRSYRARSGPVKLNVHTADVFLSIDKAVPCGLIVNELVSNALKHAFPSNGDSATFGIDTDNEIHIDLSADPENQVTLLVGDNGVGFPQDLDVQTMDSLGLRLVHTLVSQLEGTLELQSDKGAKFRLTFSESLI